MSMYSISGVSGCDCGCGVGRTTRTQRKAKRQARKTGVNCKGSRAKAILLSVPRNAFLSLVKLNFKNFAYRLYKKTTRPEQAQKLYDKWCKLGGSAKTLRIAINVGLNKYNRRKKTSYKIGLLDNFGIGDAGVTESLLATASAIIVALQQFLKKESDEATTENVQASESDTIPTEQPVTEGETVEGISYQKPLLIAGAIGLGYYLLKKKKLI
jgi:hypothetical protein